MKKWRFALIGLMACLCLQANDRAVLFKNITNKDGLSHSTVFAITQDSTGYMWFATQDGLNRYDGYEFKVFRDDEAHSTVISNYIRCLFVDQEGLVWIGGNNGISKYDDKSEQFTNYALFLQKEGRFISSIVQFANGEIWAASVYGKLFRYQKDTDSFNEVKLSWPDNAAGKNISTLYAYGNNLLIATEQGLFNFDMSNQLVSRINLPDNNAPIRTIVNDTEGSFWLGSEGDGVIVLNSHFEVTSHFKHSISETNSLSNNNVRSLCFDESGKLWIGTFIGLSILDVNNQTFSNYAEEFDRPYALSQNSVRSIYKDIDGGMWLGTFFGGIDYYHPSNIKFDILNQNGGRLSLSDNVVSAISEDENGNFWILTNDDGLNFWDRNKQSIQVIRHNEKESNSLSSNNLKSIEYGHKGKLLIGTHNAGLNYYDIRTNQNKVFRATGKVGDLSDDNVYALLKDSKQRIWVGTWKGLNRFDETNQSFTAFYIDQKGNRLTSDQISYLFEDSRGRIWIGTFEGINIFYPERNTFEAFSQTSTKDRYVPANEITCINEDSKGRIWVGTRSGLCVFDEIERNFINISTNEGLPNRFVYGILEDDNGLLWISTNGGLACYNPASKRFINYNKDDGIQDTQFNNYSFCKATTGELLFGGINGITIFNPSNIKETNFNNEVIFTQLSLYNDIIKPGDESGLLAKSLHHTSTIELAHNQNVFTIDFTAINYIDANKIKYQFKLDGYDAEWRYSDVSRNAYYSNIRPGSYTFEVRAVIDGVVDSNSMSSLEIIVAAPWWQTFWAYLSYFCVMLILFFVAYKLLNERLKVQQQLRIERLEKHKITEVNQMKLQFFTNISHEFRTPLTLIISPLQKIIERKGADDWLNKQHDIIYRNAKRLMTLIDQLMDFRKSELGELKLNVSRNELVGFINEIYLSFALAASQNNIIYTFDSKEENLNCLFDQSYIEKIAFNLLSNAFKYTPAGGTIGINLYREDNWVVIQVKDSGKGIPAEKLSLIFERFYRIDENSSKPGSGIGLALTKRLVELHHGTISATGEEGKGSVFTVRIPLDDDYYFEDELIHHQEISSEETAKPGIELREAEIIQLEEEEHKSETVLLVEDNKDIINYLRDNLKASYNIVTAANGKEALEKIYEEEPELIVSDIMMPEMDGLTFCKSLKQNIKTCHVPLILVTAKNSVDDQIKGHQLGADDYVVKPFEMNLLEAKIKNLIKTRKRLKELYSQSNSIKPESIAFNNLDKELLDKALAVVEEHLQDAEFSVDLFAREMGMSRSNLHLKMKAITGASATDFIKKVRFNQALKLLEENRYSVAEISYMVGFNSPSYFSTSFKKHFGYLPTEHLEKIRNRD
ncbi:MAG: response regulator [Carboxylicivirga sp.]|jgi:signal transduction histidine kinase/ligand-binding sensor domain-containing protein/DNA-binding response OmpR family regulator|nr:response regulator [Carboxylicivirga sp.]